MQLAISIPALPHFSTLPDKRYDFRKKVIGHKMRAVILSTNLSETFLITRTIERNIIKNVLRSSCEDYT